MTIKRTVELQQELSEAATRVERRLEMYAHTEEERERLEKIGNLLFDAAAKLGTVRVWMKEGEEF